MGGEVVSGWDRKEKDGMGTVICIGFSRLPQSVAPIGGANVIALELAVEEESTRVAAASVVGAPPFATQLLQELLVGQPLPRAMEQARAGLQRRYAGIIQRALIAAVTNAYDAYEAARKGRADAPQARDVLASW